MGGGAYKNIWTPPNPFWDQGVGVYKIFLYPYPKKLQCIYN